MYVIHGELSLAVFDYCTRGNSSISRPLNQPCIKVTPGNGKFGSFLQVVTPQGELLCPKTLLIPGKNSILVAGALQFSLLHMKSQSSPSANFLCIPQ